MSHQATAEEDVTYLKAQSIANTFRVSHLTLATAFQQFTFLHHQNPLKVFYYSTIHLVLFFSVSSTKSPFRCSVCCAPWALSFLFFFFLNTKSSLNFVNNFPSSFQASHPRLINHIIYIYIYIYIQIAVLIFILKTLIKHLSFVCKRCNAWISRDVDWSTFGEDQCLRLPSGKMETAEPYKTSVPLPTNTRRHIHEHLNVNFHNRENFTPQTYLVSESAAKKLG